MPRTNQIPYLSPSRRAPGATYHWKPSPRLRRLGWSNLRLGADYDAAVDRAREQNREVERWLSANADKAPDQRKPVRILRWHDLVADYRLGDGYLALKPKSRREYDSRIRTLDRWALDGQLRLSDLDRPMIVDLRDTLVRDPQGRKHRTAALLRVLSVLCGHGTNRGWLPLGLASSIDIPNPPKRRHRLTIEQLPWLLDAADALALPHVRLGTVLGFFTMQREGDLLATTSFRFREVDDISAEARRALAGPDGRVLGLFLEQQKTGASVGVALVPRARAEVEAAIATAQSSGSNYTQLIVKSGRPCHEKTFQRDFARVRDHAAAAAWDVLQRSREVPTPQATIRKDEALHAALAGLQFRDLRRSGMCWLRELRVPVPMIASISGHSIKETTDILDTYMPRDTRSAAEGMAIAVLAQAERDAADAADLAEQEQAQ